MPPGLPLPEKIYQFVIVYVFDNGLYLNNLVPGPAEYISITKPEVPAELIYKALISNFCCTPPAGKRLRDNTLPPIVSNTMRR
jgi:hypothetical protein